MERHYGNGRRQPTPGPRQTFRTAPPARTSSRSSGRWHSVNMGESDDYILCSGCGQPMTPGRGCTVTTITLAGRPVARLALGGESKDWWLGRDPHAVCHDCNVVTGQLHHVGCDMEQCPKCGDQLLGCGCEADNGEPPGQKGPDFFADDQGDGWWNVTPKTLACRIAKDTPVELESSRDRPRNRYWLVHVEPAIKKTELGPETTRALVFFAPGRNLRALRASAHGSVSFTPVDPATRDPEGRLVFRAEHLWAGAKVSLRPVEE